jgi:hypothetical protein
MLADPAAVPPRLSTRRPEPGNRAAGLAWRWLPGLVLGVSFAAAAGLGLSQLLPPPAVPADAPAVAFSAERAVRHLETIAHEPRPGGSPGHAAARAYLVAEITRLGLAPEVQATTTASRFPGSPAFDAAAVQNVITRLPGTASTGAILLNAHYDGGLSGPAAGDCGACVATLLETMRALRAGPPMRNDVVFVFSDAEEVGDLGAHAFATQHPWMRDVRLALNFESQGTRGPAILYATSAGNRGLIGEAARAAPHALTSSFTAGLIALVPEQRLACDLQDYLDQGSAGLGFFFGGNTPAYHTVLDTPEALDARTVQHFGSYALALTTHFGQTDLAGIRDDGDAVFFNLARGWVVHHPAGWMRSLAVAGLLLALALIAMGVRERRVGGRRVLLAALAVPLGVVLSMLVVTVTWWTIRQLNPNLQVVQVGSYGSAWYLAGLLALGAAGTSAGFGLLRRWFSFMDLAAGSMVAFGGLAVLVAEVFTPGSYLLAWPMLASLPALAWMLVAPRAAMRQGWPMATVALAVVVATALLLPAGLVGFSALTVRLDSLSGLPVFGLPALFVVLLGALLLPFAAWLLDDAAEQGRVAWPWRLTATATALALMLLGVGTARSRFNEEQPRPNQMMYELDADRGTADWVTGDARLDEWTGQFIPPTTARNPEAGRGTSHSVPTYAAPAPLLPVPSPEVTVLEQGRDGDARVLHLRLVSPRAAPLLMVTVTADGPVLAAAIGGYALDLGDYPQASQGKLTLMYAALPPEGVELTLRLESAGLVRVELADWTTDLPSAPGMLVPRRPPGMMPIPGGNYEGTRVRRSFQIRG